MRAAAPPPPAARLPAATGLLPVAASPFAVAPLPPAAGRLMKDGIERRRRKERGGEEEGDEGRKRGEGRRKRIGSEKRKRGDVPILYRVRALPYLYPDRARARACRHGGPRGGAAGGAAASGGLRGGAEAAGGAAASGGLRGRRRGGAAARGGAAVAGRRGEEAAAAGRRLYLLPPSSFSPPLSSSHPAAGVGRQVSSRRQRPARQHTGWQAPAVASGGHGGRQRAGDSMPRENICGDGPGVGLVVRRCPWWSYIMRDTKARVDARERSNKVVIYFESSSICVSPGFCDLTGNSPAVRPAASGGQTGGARAVRPAATSVGSRRSWRFDRSIYIGQIDVYQAVRPAHPLRSDHDPSNSRRWM
uniref:Uncharacterized protein n=1 Tax=Oryza sativa subsp. japonica TaxID=39947 RepID=Q84TS0_ORYSJ|nr:hypothetical protein [Oryza sativa Japonica Group]